jgi:16S rRNA A1518/A1519 N6-dimethyltransferase RsmA/KsgA/DIM1 with predicted DNA glycosylase/AP lyase activity
MPRSAPAEWGVDSGAMLAFASLAFQHKRKTLRNNLREAYPAIDQMRQAGLRAEQMPVEDLVKLYREIASV